MFFRLSFATLILAAVALGTPVRRDATQVENDLKDLVTKTKTLIMDINNFNGPLQEALLVHEDAQGLAEYLQTTTKDVNASPSFTEAQGKNVFEIAEDGLAPGVKQALSALQDKKAKTPLPERFIAESDLEELYENTGALRDTLVPKMPADLQTATQNLFATVLNALDAAIAAYSTWP